MIRTTPSQNGSKMRRTKTNGNGRGRPTKYQNGHVNLARQICLLCHSLDEIATIIKLAEFFEVGDATITRWMKEHDDFRVAIKEGRQRASGEVVASLYKKAIGYDYTETKITYNSAGKEMNRVETVKHVAGDTGAMCFALKNWASDYWKDRREIVGDPSRPLIPTRSRLDVHLLDDGALDILMAAILASRHTELDDGTSPSQDSLH